MCEQDPVILSPIVADAIARQKQEQTSAAASQTDNAQED